MQVFNHLSTVLNLRKLEKQQETTSKLETTPLFGTTLHSGPTEDSFTRSSTELLFGAKKQDPRRPKSKKDIKARKAKAKAKKKERASKNS